MLSAPVSPSASWYQIQSVKTTSLTVYKLQFHLFAQRGGEGMGPRTVNGTIHERSINLGRGDELLDAGVLY